MTGLALALSQQTDSHSTFQPKALYSWDVLPVRGHSGVFTEWSADLYLRSLPGWSVSSPQLLCIRCIRSADDNSSAFCGMPLQLTEHSCFRFRLVQESKFTCWRTANNLFSYSNTSIFKSVWSMCCLYKMKFGTRRTAETTTTCASLLCYVYHTSG